jgi:hypothetical protein
VAAEREQPNAFQLHGADLQVTYATSSFQGPPELSYTGPTGEVRFSGDEIRAAPSELGTEVTVTLASIADGGTTTLTILIPWIQLGEEGHESFDTIAIETVNRTSIAGPPPGAEQTYAVSQLSGEARLVRF